MSLTYHQKNNTDLWQALTRVIDQSKVESFVSQVNRMAFYQRRLGINARSNDFDFKTLGKSVIYSFYYTFYPEACTRDSIAGRFLQREGILARILKLCKDDPYLLAIAFAMAEATARRGKITTAGYLTGIKSLTGSFQHKALYDDLALIAQSFGAIHQPGKSVNLNVTFNKSHLVGGADAQALIDGELLSTITTLRRHPLAAEKVNQQLAYFLLDYLYPEEALTNSPVQGRTVSNISHLSFHLSRTQQIIRTNPYDYLKPLDDPSWEDWANCFGTQYNLPPDPDDDLFNDPDFRSAFFHDAPWQDGGWP
ncbi:hypothetical protein [Nodosilinea nodulosa]|uniref:hypothetical protein n=1 Tax=Nodosilinea nodulosa TaxID=416001 RepID=UPI0003133B23|nr:hypothetical protein [Nodosilinea nodulosa]